MKNAINLQTSSQLRRAKLSTSCRLHVGIEKIDEKAERMLMRKNGYFNEDYVEFIEIHNPELGNT
ncbi:MAG: hypothetical protein QXJ64_06705 [Thermosphaera sp.]